MGQGQISQQRLRMEHSLSRGYWVCRGIYLRDKPAGRIAMIAMCGILCTLMVNADVAPVLMGRDSIYGEFECGRVSGQWQDSEEYQYLYIQGISSSDSGPTDAFLIVTVFLRLRKGCDTNAFEAYLLVEGLRSYVVARELTSGDLHVNKADKHRTIDAELQLSPSECPLSQGCIGDPSSAEVTLRNVTIEAGTDIPRYLNHPALTRFQEIGAWRSDLKPGSGAKAGKTND